MKIIKCKNSLTPTNDIGQQNKEVSRENLARGFFGLNS